MQATKQPRKRARKKADRPAVPVSPRKVIAELDRHILVDGFKLVFDVARSRGSRFFDAANHPNISFKADQAKFDGDKLVSITGDLNIKGISKPVTLTLNSFVAGPHPIQKKRDGIGANAVAKVNRSDFGMDFQVPLVADEVALAFTVQAFKER